MYLTIQEFSKRTGLSPSTLRFYDRKKLLVPARRLENGYRAYEQEQITDALTIHSLRCADVTIQDIKTYLEAEEARRHELVLEWRKRIVDKLSTLKVAQQYLGGFLPRENLLHLTKWEEQTFIWFKHRVPRKERAFQEVMATDQKLVAQWGNEVSPSIFIRTLDAKAGEMLGEVGFIVNPAKLTLPQAEAGLDVYVQTMEPTLFAMLECSADDPFLCFRFIQLIRQYGFKVDGLKLEKYDTPFEEKFVYLIPLMKSS